MYSTFLNDSPGSVLFSRSNLLKRKDLWFSCLRLCPRHFFNCRFLKRDKTNKHRWVLEPLSRSWDDGNCHNGDNCRWVVTTISTLRPREDTREPRPQSSATEALAFWSWSPCHRFLHDSRYLSHPEDWERATHSRACRHWFHRKY